MSEFHHTNPESHDREQPLDPEVVDVPRYTPEQQEAILERVYAARREARLEHEVRSVKERAPDLAEARRKLEEYFARNGRERDKKPSVESSNPPRIYRGDPQTEPILNDAAEGVPQVEEATEAPEDAEPKEPTINLEAPEDKAEVAGNTQEAVKKATQRITDMEERLSSIESAKNGRIDNTVAALTRVRQGLQRLSQQTSRLTDRDMARRIVFDLEQTTGILRGVYTAEKNRTEVGRDTRSTISRLDGQVQLEPEARQRIDAGMNDLRTALNVDRNTHTVEEGAVIDILRHTSRVSEHVLYGEPSALAHEVDKIIKKLEQQKHPKGIDSKLMKALKAVEKSLS